MSVTAQEVLNIVYALGNELDDNGQPDDTTDLEVRTPGILTALQAELIKEGDIYSTYEIACKPATNLLGDTKGYEYEEFTGEDITKEASGSVKAYYFEVSDDATVYIEDFTSGWNVLATITCAPTTSGFTAYRAKVTPTTGATKSRIRFSGTNRYLFVNYALFSLPFASNGDVPTYRQLYKVTMPTDFKSVDQIVNEYPIQQYNSDTAYKWEGFKDLYVNYDYEGVIRIIYRPIPSTITALTDSLQVDDVTARSVIPWGLAMELYKEANQTKFAYFERRYREMKSLATIKQPVSEKQTVNVYGNF
jgi:hypothetical protein